MHKRTVGSVERRPGRWRGVGLGLLVVGLSAALAPHLAAKDGRAPPKGRALEEAVTAYLDGNFGARESMRRTWDETLAPLDARSAKRIRKAMLEAAFDHGRKLNRKSGTHFFYDEEAKRGKYIVKGKPGKALFFGLHGGGEGSGSAESAASQMGGGGWWWIHPEVLVKTEVGWRDNGTEEFVVELIEAAKRTGKIDPNRIYITGHSMGGGGSWMIGGHHADLFAGVAAYAGAPSPVWADRAMTEIKAITPGVLPNYYALPLHVYQSGDDENVPPGPNDFAMKAMEALEAKWPAGFTFKYDRVEGRGHAGPAEGYLPSQKWIASHARNARPKTFLWQPSIGWKRQMYWCYWARAEEESLWEFRALGDNTIELIAHEGSGDTTGMSLLLGAPLVDLDKEVVVKVDGEEVFRGMVQRTFSTLMMTIPRYDNDLLFEARIDL